MLATARNEFDPAWSPTGDQFAFVTDRSGSIEILEAQPGRAMGTPDCYGR